MVRGRRNAMLDDSDVHWHRQIKACVGGVAAAVTGDPAVFVSVSAAHQVPRQLSIATLGRSAPLVELRKRLAQLAQTSAPLLLRGEEGMLPEVFARQLSAPGAPFLAGAALLADASSDLLARASGGILFVPDLARLQRAEQKNLDFLQTRAERHRVRIVSFSPVEARVLVERHTFDPALVARLGELTLRLPALRDFSEDIPVLAAQMLAQLVEAAACPPRRFSIGALNALRHHRWPGNLAELEHAVKNLALSALEEEVGVDDVTRVLDAQDAAGAPELALDRPYREARVAFERAYFENLLMAESGSMSRVAERSGLERTHLYRKLRALGLPVGRREEG
jgi:DNA-binding NtrC family response regulator